MLIIKAYKKKIRYFGSFKKNIVEIFSNTQRIKTLFWQTSQELKFDRESVNEWIALNIQLSTYSVNNIGTYILFSMTSVYPSLLAVLDMYFISYIIVHGDLDEAALARRRSHPCWANRPKLIDPITASGRDDRPPTVATGNKMASPTARIL